MHVQEWDIVSFWMTTIISVDSEANYILIYLSNLGHPNPFSNDFLYDNSRNYFYLQKNRFRPPGADLMGLWPSGRINGYTLTLFGIGV